MTLFYWNVLLSVQGRWYGVHKSTILRRLLALALDLWRTVSQVVGERLKSRMVNMDEKWFKIRGRGQCGFVVLDVSSELPMLAAVPPSRSQWVCRWISRHLHGLKKVSRVVITAGLQAYEHLEPGPSMSSVACISSLTIRAQSVRSIQCLALAYEVGCPVAEDTS
jgi:hypothetical protein